MYTNIFEKFCTAVNEIVSTVYETDLQFHSKKTALINIENQIGSSSLLRFLLEEINGEVVISALGSKPRGFKNPTLAAKYIMMELEYANTEHSNNFKFNKKIQFPLQEMKVIKETTVGALKRKLNESREKTALGMGFGDKPAYESNVEEEMQNYQRRINNKGGFGLGQGFKPMSEVQMVNFIENIVENLKGKTEYHNLKFVDRLGSEYHLTEGQVKTIKSIIKEGTSKSPKKLKKFINENIAPESAEMYEGYYGLTNEAEAMIPEIKKTFNENKKSCGSVSEAVSMTAEALDLPVECVQEMYDKLKESYEMKMEGQSMDVNSALYEVYNKYKSMSEGNMDSMYEEISDMMMYDEPESLNEVGPFSDEEMELFSGEDDDFEDSYDYESEDEYDPFEEYFADNPEDEGYFSTGDEELYEMDDEFSEFGDEDSEYPEWLNEDDELCEECDDDYMYESVKKKV